jgi:hypothetical protein
VEVAVAVVVIEAVAVAVVDDDVIVVLASLFSIAKSLSKILFFDFFRDELKEKDDGSSLTWLWSS